jgi:hypothetical protein
MKKFIISVFLAFLAFSTLVVAEEKNDKIDEAKQQILQSLDKEMARVNQVRAKEDAIMNQFKSCIQNIKSEADFGVCNNAKNESVKKYRVEMEKAYLDEQKKAIANEEKRLNSELKATKK